MHCAHLGGMTTTNLITDQAREKALSLVGQGYIYGAKGQICSPAFRQQQAAQYPDQASNILGTGAKWDGMPVWDCAQLTRAVASAAGVTLVSGATSQWTKTAWARQGETASLPEDELVFLYRRQSGSATVMAHTGVALGDGTCVHARGTAYGVVRQKMPDYAWTHWASPWVDGSQEGGESMEELYKATVTAASGSTVNLRSAPDGALVTRVPIGTVVSVYEDSSGWSHIRAGDADGWMQSTFLVPEVNDDADESVSVTLPRSVALAVMEALGRATAQG